MLLPAPAGPSMAMTSFLLWVDAGWLTWFFCFASAALWRTLGRGTLGVRTGGTARGGVHSNMARLPICTKLNSRAAIRALMASRTRERAMKFEKNSSTSLCSAAITQPMYFETRAVSASAREIFMPSRTGSGDQRNRTSQNAPSTGL